MNTILIFFIIFIAFIAVAVFIHLSNKFAPNNELQVKQYNNSNLTANKPAYQYTPTPTWGPPDSNTACNTYTFIGGQYIPAAPSYQKLNEDGYRGVYVSKFSPSPCLDIDQLYAQDVTIECMNPSGTNAGAGCILSVPTYVGNVLKYPGDYVPRKTKQGSKGEPGSSPFFAQCVPSNAIQNQNGGYYCMGDIGLIIPNFTKQNNFQEQANNCLVGEYTGNTGTTELSMKTSLQGCDLSEPQQIFRMVRYSLDSSGNLNQDDQGNLASIVHRYTGYYLAPDLPLYKDPILKANYWGFNSPNYINEEVTDNVGNTFKQYISLKLINPAYDTSRNGVYWLFQPRTFDARVSNTDANFNSYANQGVFVNQTGYEVQFPTGPAVPGYINSLLITTPAPQGGKRFIVTDPTYSGSLSAGWDGSFTPDTPIAPQQVVYVPDIRLLPTNNQDPDAMWSYLVNNFSINIINGTKGPFPALTPYRQFVNNIVYNYTSYKDPKNGGNYFTVLLPHTGVTGSNGPDTQFIDYTSYRTQITTNVLGGPGND